MLLKVDKTIENADSKFSQKLCKRRSKNPSLKRPDSPVAPE